LPVHCTFAARHDENRGANRSESEQAGDSAVSLQCRHGEPWDEQQVGWLPSVFLPGMPILADLRARVDRQNAVGHAALSIQQ
jgi:hypothetical protein